MSAPAELDQVIISVTEAIEALSMDEELAIDLETGGLSPWNDPIAVVTMYGVQSGRTALLHIRGDMPPELREFLSEPTRTYIGHNMAGFDMLFLANYGVDVFGPTYYDTMIGEQVTITSGRRDIRVNLQDTVARRTGVKITKGHGKDTWMAPTLTPEQVKYCVEDVMYLPKIRQAQLERVEGTAQARTMKFEQGLIPIVVQMVLNGLPLDEEALDEWLVEQEVKAVEAYELIDREVGHINVNSGKQIMDAFKRVFSIDLPNTEVETMQPYCEDDGIVGAVATAIMIARRARKRVNMYDAEWVGKYVTEGRVHSRFWTCSTDTSRFSSSEPNLQQIPVDGRKVFGGVEGHTVVSVDFNSLEVRIAAAMADDKNMIEALGSTDIHRTVAASIFEKPFLDITKEERKLAKAATFTLLFGGSAAGLVRYARASGSHLSDVEAKRIVRQFFNTYRGLAIARRHAQDLGASGRPVPVVLSSGFRRVLVPSNGQVNPSQILNSNVQGNAAVGMKRALMLCNDWGLMPYICATVHDELVAVVPDPLADEVKQYIERAMIQGMGDVIPNCPVRVESKVGFHWS